MLESLPSTRGFPDSERIVTEFLQGVSEMRKIINSELYYKLLIKVRDVILKQHKKSSERRWFSLIKIIAGHMLVL